MDAPTEPTELEPDDGFTPAPRVVAKPSEFRPLQIGPLTVDVGRKEIQVHGADVPVTRIEFALFEQLCRHPAEVRARVQLLEEVWGPNWVGDTHVVDVHLSNLRRKIGSASIRTVRGVGYALEG